MYDRFFPIHTSGRRGKMYFVEDLKNSFSVFNDIKIYSCSRQMIILFLKWIWWFMSSWFFFHFLWYQALVECDMSKLLHNINRRLLSLSYHCNKYKKILNLVVCCLHLIFNKGFFLIDTYMILPRRDFKFHNR